MKKRIGLVGNHAKPVIKKAAGQVVDFFRDKKNYELMVDSSLSHVLPNSPTKIIYELIPWSDLLIVLGGDGTLLSIVPYISNDGPEVLAVNLGQLGFLTEFNPIALGAALEKWLKGQSSIRERMLLEVSSDSKKNERHLVLNEAAVTKGSFSRILSLDVFVADQHLTNYRCDGLIISTPTGSTAYSLSSGGPIVEPELSLILITPICPHTLSNRPLLVSDQYEIKIVLRSDVDDAGLTLDGRKGMLVIPNEVISVCKAKEKLHLVQGENSFFKIVKEKLGWAGAMDKIYTNKKGRK